MSIETVQGMMPLMPAVLADGSATQIQRQLANFDPSTWGEYFTTCTCDTRSIQEWREEAETLKERVKKLLTADLTTNQLGERLSMIDAIQRLGIAYHFEKEIQELLQCILELYVSLHEHDYELHTVALLFRLLRQHGHYISCEIFTKFIDSTGNFKDAVREDIQSMLSLYEATYLRVQGENMLDAAAAFTKTTLEAKVTHLQPYLAAHISQALRRPLRKAIPRLAAREYITFYQENAQLRNELLLKLAKLDFNLLQKQHQEELRIISKWWRNIDVQKNWPYARDRLVECYFWALGVYYEPQYALARKFLTKVFGMSSILDDTYDAYGTFEELEHLTEAIQRWEVSAVDGLPECMKNFYKTLMEVYSEMEKDLAEEGRFNGVHYAKESIKLLANAYFSESKWLHDKKTPSVEEYMETAVGSTGYTMLAVTSLVGMGQIATQEAFEWLMAEPPTIQAVCRICRLMDDIVSHQFEQKRKHIPSAIECYMRQHNVSANEAYVELNKQVDNAWKDINQAFLDPRSPSLVLLTRVLNLAQMMDLLYKDEDMYTHCEKMKPYIASLLVNELDE